MKMNEELTYRVNKYIEKYDGDKLRRGLRLFARITRLSEDDLKTYIEEQRRLPENERDKYAGLAQSVLYTKVKRETGDWKKAYNEIGNEFDLPYGGALITADNDRELEKAVFSRYRAGAGAEFSGNYAGVEAMFSGNYAGAWAEFSGDSAGRRAKFFGFMAGYEAMFSGDYAGACAMFSGDYAGKNAVFSGDYAGVWTMFSGDYAGACAKFSGDYAGEGAKFSGKRGGVGD